MREALLVAAAILLALLGAVLLDRPQRRGGAGVSAAHVAAPGVAGDTQVLGDLGGGPQVTETVEDALARVLAAAGAQQG